MAYDNLDQVMFLQFHISNLFMRKHNISAKQFLEIDDKYDLLGFLEEGYEPFHLTGDQGVLCEIEDYIALGV